jgi:hypothetical protein
LFPEKTAVAGFIRRHKLMEFEKSRLASLPDPGGAFASILLVSHATYLGTKAYNAGGKSGNGKWRRLA